MTTRMLTHARLLTVLAYDAASGEFSWLQSRWPKKIGAKAGRIHHLGYTQISIDSVRYLGHRLAWFYVHGHWPRFGIDHIDGNPRNNKISNLREATPVENGRNRASQRGSTSRFKGVTLHRQTGKWQAGISAGGRFNYLGLFTTEIAAAKAYDEAAAQLFGSFARINLLSSP